MRSILIMTLFFFTLQVTILSQTDDSHHAPDSTTRTEQEALVRSTYRRLSILNTHRLLSYEGNDHVSGVDLGRRSLRFSIKNFRIGHVDEIQDVAYRSLVTASTGTRLYLTYIPMMGTRGGIDAVWRTGPPDSTSGFEGSVGDMLRSDPVRFADVRTYVSYESVVSFDGRTRAYRSLAVFAPGQDPHVEFLDEVVGPEILLRQISRRTDLPIPDSRASETSGDLFGANERATRAKKSTIRPELMAAPGEGGACLEWYFTPIDPSYTFCTVWEPGWGYGGGGDYYETVLEGSNTIYYSFNRQEIIDSSLKRCVFRACYETDQNPSNGCFDSSYLEFTDIVNTGDACGPGVRITYSRYRIPLLGFSFCARFGHSHLSFNPCTLGNL